MVLLIRIAQWIADALTFPLPPRGLDHLEDWFSYEPDEDPKS